MIIGHHGIAGHRGLKALSSMLRRKFWIHQLQTRCDEFCANCLIFLQTKGGTPRPWSTVSEHPKGTKDYNEMTALLVHRIMVNNGCSYWKMLRVIIAYLWQSECWRCSFVHARIKLAVWDAKDLGQCLLLSRICDLPCHLRNPIHSSLLSKYRLFRSLRLSSSA